MMNNQISVNVSITVTNTKSRYALIMTVNITQFYVKLKKCALSLGNEKRESVSLVVQYPEIFTK